MLVLVLLVLVGLFINDSVDLCLQIIQQVEGIVLNVVGLIIQQAAVGMYTFVVYWLLSTFVNYLLLCS